MKAKEETKQMKDFKENFALIRQATGWSTAELASRTGASPQTINNIELNNSKLTTMAYYAIRYALESEMKEHPDENEMLKYVLDAFVDNREKYTDEERQAIREKTEMLSPSLKGKKANKKEISKIWKAVLAGSVVAIASAITIAGITAWRKK